MMTLFNLFVVLIMFFFLPILSWFSTAQTLVFEYNKLRVVWSEKSFLYKLATSIFYWSFLGPCAVFTNDRTSVAHWLFLALFLKNIAILIESIALTVVFFLFVSLLFEHLFFALCYHNVPVFNRFFNNLYGSELLHYCLGNMWKAPTKKIAGAAGLLVYEVGVSVGSDIMGNYQADNKKLAYPNMSLQEHNRVSEEVSAKYFNRFSLSGNFGHLLKKMADKSEC